MLSAVAILPFLDVAAKFLGQQGMPVLESVWGRLALGFVMTLPFVVKGRPAKALMRGPWLMHAARAFLLIAGTGFFFLGLAWLPIADTLSIFFVQPLIVTMLAPLMLKEHVGARRWIAVFIGFLGTLIIIRPGFQSLNPGVLFALLAGMASALYLILTRKIASQADPIVTMFQTNAMGAVMASLALPFVWHTPSWEQWGLLAVLALVATLGHYLMVAAYRFAEASLLAPLSYGEMIMAVVCGWWFFGDFPDRWTFTGVGILIACAVYISYRERVRGIPADPTPPQP
jgi:drug/metabolite transporter (DMT)-like permease